MRLGGLNEASDKNLLVSNRLHHAGYLNLLAGCNGESSLGIHGVRSQTCVYFAGSCLQDEMRAAQYLPCGGRLLAHAAHCADEGTSFATAVLGGGGELGS